jgi:hypothetical protein
LIFSDAASLQKQGRSFDCSTCLVAKKRRCQEDRWDFAEKDDPMIFPIQVHKGGAQYGFCPAKATWDSNVSILFRTLHVAAHTGVMWQTGGIKDQPQDWIELLSWFIQRYDAENFSSKARSILGDGSKQGSAQTNGNIRGKAKR